MAQTYRWDENIPDEIKKNNKKGDEMVEKLLRILANENYCGSSPRKTFCSMMDEDEEDEEPVQPAPDPRPDWQIKNAEAFEAHVAHMRKWLDEMGLDTHIAVGPAFDRFVQNAIPELTTPLDYYDEHDAMRDYRDYEDWMDGY